MNLVHNAIVHNLPERGTVWITTGVHSKGAVLTVENTGEKLNPQVVATLAEPFLRGTKRIRTDHAGVGLGLAIAKSITQAHDGTLTLTPRAAGALLALVLVAPQIARGWLSAVILIGLIVAGIEVVRNIVLREAQQQR